MRHSLAGIAGADFANKTEAEIDWEQSAEQIDRVVRTFNPNPGAYTYFRDIILKIWQAKVVAGRAAGKPGEIISVDREGITVACGSNMLQVEIVQKPGGKKLSCADFLAGNNLQPGENFSAVKHSTSKHD